ncbi:hypothetical protein DV515_00005767 [Chloebia gouldiae]|uniref:Uncharacterized protein n=1 Tax=Chloebia gouldiae TaxID=44316 RepID=A0A3L8SMQ3_CHLGU|nr:hypothetical protein DV515_00005767 [Chloebia gouldiae]
MKADLEPLTVYVCMTCRGTGSALDDDLAKHKSSKRKASTFNELSSLLGHTSTEGQDLHCWKDHPERRKLHLPRKESNCMVVWTGKQENTFDIQESRGIVVILPLDFSTFLNRRAFLPFSFFFFFSQYL